MAILEIMKFPDKRLRNVAEPVVQVDDKVRQTVDDMLETMYAAAGIGLAAIQVNIRQSIIVIDTSDDRDRPLCLINPDILECEGHAEIEEGCLSVPNYSAKVQRSAKVKLSALNRCGEPFVLDAEGLLAICIQHEMDHLKGKLFVDYLSPLKRESLVRLIKRNHVRETQAIPI